MRNVLILLFIHFPIISFSYSIMTDSLDYPQIGKPCPDFTLQNVEYFTKSTANLSDFKGKWLILDFWTEYCVSCIESFPKLNAIQQEFKSDIQILLIGTPRGNPQMIRNLFETHREQKKLNLPIAYENSLSDRFGVSANPFILIIDPQGMVRYITHSFDRDHILELLNNRTPKLTRSYTKFDIKAQDSYDRNTPLLINNNGGDNTSYLFRSLLTEYNKLQSFVYSTQGMPERLEMLGFDLTALYKYAYGGFANTFFSTDTTKYGKIWPQLIFETNDTTIFKGNYPTRENLFSYSVHVTDRYFERFGNKEFDFRHVLRNDLSACFPYTVSIEKRLMPCDYLVISDADLSKLRTRVQEYKFEWIGGKRAGFAARKIPVSQLLNQISGSLGHPEDVPLIYDGENILIDIDIQSIYYEDRIKELKKLGFSIVRRKKEMNVIVIRDK